MNFDKMQQLVNSLSQSLEKNEKLATPILAAKLSKCIEAYPQDQTLGSMSRVLEKMASNNNLFITRTELQGLYKKLYSSNTKFAELFEQELGSIPELATPVVYQRDEATTNVQPYQVQDQILSNALSSAFDNSIPLKRYSQLVADKAVKSVTSSLDAWNLTPQNLLVEEGNDKFLVLKADYDTPKGVTSLYVPVEVHENKVSEATIFVSNAGVQDLNYTNIKKYLVTCAGNKSRLSSSLILDTLISSSSSNREISAAEIALTKLNASKQGKSEFFQNQIVGQKIAEASAKDVQLPKYEESVSLEKNFSSAYGMASFQFGNDKVKMARDNINRGLLGFGYKNAQMSVINNDAQTIFYGVSLDGGKVAFTVPVKVANNKVSTPTIMLCGKAVLPFSREEINQLYVKNQTDYKVAAAASPLFELSSSELLENIKTALSENNYAKAEDALNVLAQSNDQDVYAVGFNLYLHGLNNKTASTTEHTCSMLVKNSTSQHPICGHTGLPAHKVYQDKQGNCRPLYRRGMDESYESATFMNAKILG